MEAFVFIGLLIAVLYLINKHFLQFWEKRGFVQLNPKFLIGDLGGLFFGRSTIGEYMKDLYFQNKQHKAVGIYFSYRPALVVNDPMLIQDILIKDFSSFHDRPLPVNEEFDPLTGHLFSLPGQKWRDLRVKISPTFTSGKLKGMFSTIKDCTKVLEDYIVKNVKQGTDVFEFLELMKCFNTNVISSVAFGIENDCINEPDNIFRKMGNKMTEPTLRSAVINMFQVFLPNVFNHLRVKTLPKGVEEFIFSVVKQTIEHREKNNVTRNDFMQMMIQLKNQGYVSVDKGEATEEFAVKAEEIKKLTVNEIAAQTFIFFAAGFETSSTTMFYVLFELARNHAIQHNAQEEIDRVLKEMGPEGLTYDALSSLKYLECCIDEALRKYPIASLIIRECTKDYKIANTDLVIPKGTSIFIPSLGHHRDPDIYEYPMEFRPERFFESPNGGGKAKGVFYTPFGDGPRNCIGMRLAKVTSKAALAVLLSNFNFELSDGKMTEKEIAFDPNVFVLTPEEKIFLKITRRTHRD